MVGIGGMIAVLTAEPEIVWNHLLQPHTCLRSDCALMGRWDHGCFLCPLGITVDEGIIQDLGHGSHRLSVCIVEPAFTVGQRVCSGSEEHGGKAVLNLPDVQFPVAGYRHGRSPPCLEEKVAHISFPGKIPGPQVSDVRFRAVEKSVLHKNLAPFVGFGMLATGCYTIIGIASLQLALGQQRAILTKKYETSKCPSTLTTGHKGCIWPKNLKLCANISVQAGKVNPLHLSTEDSFSVWAKIQQDFSLPHFPPDMRSVFGPQFFEELYPHLSLRM